MPCNNVILILFKILFIEAYKQSKSWEKNGVVLINIKMFLTEPELEMALDWSFGYWPDYFSFGCGAPSVKQTFGVPFVKQTCVSALCIRHQHDNNFSSCVFSVLELCLEYIQSESLLLLTKDQQGLCKISEEYVTVNAADWL